LNGKVWIQTLDLKSTNEKRDVNMYELLNATIHPNISFEIKSVQKVQDSYTLNGILTLNGISKEVSSNVKIVEGSDSLSMDGGFSIELTDYGIEPPKMFFLKVRNKIDISYFLSFKKAN
jgi:polyisoprenoid-binding protein YceI